MPSPADIDAIFKRRDAEERVRKQQQGEGKPIISFRQGERQIVGVGNSVYWSSEWKTFPDFLAAYIQRKLEPKWGEQEMAKAPLSRHPYMQIFAEHGRQLKALPKGENGLVEHTVTGASAVFLGVAYAIYLLDHNVELQERLLKRLRNVGNFQGAYYELLVASVLIRAGFALELIDESSGETKHCEFDAVSKKTGKRYSIEVKMRGVAGLLGRTSVDGSTEDAPKFVNLLLNALKKPASGERLVFIDVNVEHALTETGEPTWLGEVMSRLETFEATKLNGQSAYVFITNMDFHRDLTARPEFAVAPFGLGIPDFAKVGPIRFRDAYLQKKKHTDAFHIFESLRGLLSMPMTFDGSVPSEAFGGAPARLMVGETYELPGAGAEGADITAKIIDVVAWPEQKRAHVIAHNIVTGERSILEAPMTDGEIADFRQFGESYFGKEPDRSHKSENDIDMFEWLMRVNATLPRARILEWLGPKHVPYAEPLNDEDLLIYYCEAFMAGIQRDRATKAGSSTAATE